MQSISDDLFRRKWVWRNSHVPRWAKLKQLQRRLHVASGEAALVAVAALAQSSGVGYKDAGDGWMGAMKDMLIRLGLYLLVD
jgi:hypothetical protein